MKKIFLDSDIGGDIDDALALYFVLNAPETFDLLGIATNFVDVGRRAQLAKYICRLFGRDDIPVAAGFEKPLSGAWNPKQVSFQSDALTEPIPYEPMHGVDLLVETARKNPDMDILAIGPMTNIAAAILREPSIANHTITIMGGMVSAARPEWNIRCDPVAAQILFNSGANINMFGLDVTMDCIMKRCHTDQIKNRGTEKHDFMARIQAMHEEYSHHLPILHDPLAAAYYLFADQMEIRPIRIALETEGTHTRGVTADMADWDGNYPTVNVCTKINTAAMIQQITDVICR